MAPCPLSRETIDALAGWMGDGDNQTDVNFAIPAGFTYLGQFIDHDITFDPTPLAARTRADGLINFRTPRLDLDSVYGAGPLVQPFLYDWQDSEPPGARLLVGTDLPRNWQGRALVGDARNDENVIVAQLHLLFLRFHNAVVDHLARTGTADDELFRSARRLVRRHYQWIVVRDFLPKVVGCAMADKVLSWPSAGAPTVHRKHFTWKREPHIPREFSGAAYRFGHSMVRPAYGVTRLAPDPKDRPHQISIFPLLRGFRRLPAGLVIDWERFFDLEPEPPPGLPRQVQPSMRIDTSIAAPLFALPDGAPDLPRRNLLRGRKLELPSGQDVARAMGEPPLSDDELQLGNFDKRIQDALRGAAPLWFYILCEAASERGDSGKHLGPVGGRIVAEVLVGLLEGDPSSFLKQEPSWQPQGLGLDGDDFLMADLVRFVQRHPV